MENTESLLIGYTVNGETNNRVLVVGKKRLNQSVEIINAFQGDEAEELYKKLIEVKKKNAEISE